MNLKSTASLISIQKKSLKLQIPILINTSISTLSNSTNIKNNPKPKKFLSYNKSQITKKTKQNLYIISLIYKTLISSIYICI